MFGLLAFVSQRALVSERALVWLRLKSKVGSERRSDLLEREIGICLWLVGQRLFGG